MKTHPRPAFVLLLWLVSALCISSSIPAQQREVGGIAKPTDEPQRSLSPGPETLLSAEERQWLAHQGRGVRVGITEIPPQILHADGQYQGLSIDYMRAIERKLNCRFQLTPYPTWKDVIEAAKERRIDMIFAAQQTPERMEYLLFSKPYIELPNIIITRKDRQGGADLQEMNGWAVAVSEGSAVHEFLQKRYPELILFSVPNELAGLEKVSVGEVDAMVVEISRASYFIEKNKILNLRIAGRTELVYQLRFATRNDWPVLCGILDKGLSLIGNEEKIAIDRKWIDIGQPSLFTRKAFWIPAAIGIAAILVSVAGIVIWNRALRRIVAKRTAELGTELAERRKAEEALRESEMRLRIVADNTYDWEFWLNADGKINYISPSCQRITGRSADEFRLNPGLILAIIHPDDRPTYQTHEQNALAGTEQGYIEYRIVRPDGEERWIEHACQAVFDENGRFIGRRGSNRDSTAKRQAENILRESEERYRMLVETANEGIWTMDADHRTTYVNQAMADLLGYPPAEIVGKKVEEFFYAEDMPFHHQRMAKRHSGENEVYERRFKRRDGSQLWTLVSAKALMDDRGRFTGSFAMFTDITERKQAEQELRDSEARFKALHNASFGGIAIHDHGIILECNQGLSEITGYSEAELVGMDGLRLFIEQSRDTVRRNILKGYEKPYEVVGLRKDGSEYPVRLEARNIPYRGKPARTVEFRDISEMKRAEEARETLQNQLIQAQKMESVGRLAGGVAHDFNNKLGIILGNIEMILDELDPSLSIYSGLQDIQKAAVQSADLTRQLLAFARKQTISPKELDLRETVEGMLKMLRRLVGEDIDLAWLPGSAVSPVRVDPSQIDQILANLCVNARDAIKDVGRITIETSEATFDEAYCKAHAGAVPGDYVLLAVSDDGIGMSQETLRNIFEPFFTTKETGKGTGLGLSTVYGIVKQNSGFINVYSEPGRGTTFKIYLPRHEDRLQQASRQDQEEKTVGGRETVLLVEDEPAILKMTRMMLEKLGYQVLAANTPGEAIELTRGHAGEIHLLMTDVVMPEMNGRDLAIHLLSLYPNLKCLFMSGYTANVIAHHGVLDEGVNFIEKPFSKQTLAAMVRKSLTESGMTPQNLGSTS